MTRIYIDENFAKQLAEGLNTFQQHLNKKEKRQYEVVSIKTEHEGLPDEELIPIIGKNGGILITQDLRIQTARHQNELYKQHELGIFFFHPPGGGFSFWDMTLKLINHWDEIKSKTKSTKRPFAYRCTSKSGFKKLD